MGRGWGGRVGKTGPSYRAGGAARARAPPRDTGGGSGGSAPGGLVCRAPAAPECGCTRRVHVLLGERARPAWEGAAGGDRAVQGAGCAAARGSCRHAPCARMGRGGCCRRTRRRRAIEGRPTPRSQAGQLRGGAELSGRPAAGGGPRSGAQCWFGSQGYRGIALGSAFSVRLHLTIEIRSERGCGGAEGGGAGAGGGSLAGAHKNAGAGRRRHAPRARPASRYNNNRR
jgi:hypothetical protein